MKQENKQSENALRGILLTITEDGRVSNQILGRINEAEFLGLGKYLDDIQFRDGIIALSQNQGLTLDVLKKIEEAIQLMNLEKTTGDEQCGTESCSDSLPSSDSGQSSENSPSE